MEVAASKPMSLNRRLREYIDAEACVDAREAADAVLAALSEKELRELVLPMLRWNAEQILRERVRRMEGASFGSVDWDASPASRLAAAPKPGKGAVLRPNLPRRRTIIDAFAELADQTFKLPDGRSVSWGAATVADHKARADWQRNLGMRLQADALHHERAVVVIEKAKASCLNDVIAKAAA